MSINTVGGPKAQKTEKATAPVRPGITEEQGAKAIAALLSPKKREDKPASREAATVEETKKPKAPPSDEEQLDDEVEGESDDEIEIEDDTDETDEEGETPNEEDVDDEDEDEDDDVEDVDDGDDEQASVDLKAVFKHPKTGEKLTLEELFGGYLRTADYTRKTQETAKQRKELEPELKAVREERVKLADNLKLLDEALRENVPQEPNWDEEFQKDEDEASKLYARWDIYKKKLADVTAQRAAADKQVFEDQKKEIEAEMTRQNEMLLKEMGWEGDDEKAKAGRDAIWSYGKEVGFDERQLLGVSDYRLLVLMDKARRWDAAQKKAKATKAPNAPTKVVKPGSAVKAAPGQKVVNELGRVQKRLAKTGSIQDAKAGISLLLQAERAPRRR
jgi:hypothetical protein